MSSLFPYPTIAEVALSASAIVIFFDKKRVVTAIDDIKSAFCV
nr:MAG TPA: hypothetical protein [Caudoviricetes sp.]